MFIVTLSTIMSRRESTIGCPNCGKPLAYRPEARPPFFPFCSERCKLVDLGKWFDEEHRVEEPLADGQMPGVGGDAEDPG